MERARGWRRRSTCRKSRGRRACTILGCSSNTWLCMLCISASVCLYVCASSCLCVCVSACLPACLPVCLSIRVVCSVRCDLVYRAVTPPPHSGSGSISICLPLSVCRCLSASVSLPDAAGLECASSSGMGSWCCTNVRYTRLLRTCSTNRDSLEKGCKRSGKRRHLFIGCSARAHRASRSQRSAPCLAQLPAAAETHATHSLTYLLTYLLTCLLACLRMHAQSKIERESARAREKSERASERARDR